MLRLVDALMSRAVFGLVTAAALGLIAYEVWSSAQSFGLRLRCWNLPNISILLALILALYLARQLDGRMRAALRELWLRDTLPGATDPSDRLLADIFAGSGRRELLASLFILGVMVAAYAWSESVHLPIAWRAMANGNAETRGVLLTSFFLPMLLGVAAGGVAGAFFGRLITYGRAASVLAEPSHALNVRPGHFDGASGFKPIGEFYLFQAVLTAIPLLWLSGWALALPWLHEAGCHGQPFDPDYTRRLTWQFYGQWLIVAAFTYAGFVRPVLALRRRISGVRDELREHRLPAIEAEIIRLKSGLDTTTTATGPSGANAAIDALVRERAAILDMSAWPMDRSTFHRYAPLEVVSKLAPLLGPIFSQS